MDGQEVVGRLNARALLTSTERRSLNCGSALALCRRDDPERFIEALAIQRVGFTGRRVRSLARPSRQRLNSASRILAKLSFSAGVPKRGIPLSRIPT